LYVERIYWEEETSRVIARMDQLGIALLILYILFVITRHWLLQHWLHDVQLTAFSLSFSLGAMMSRVWSMRRGIRKVLKEQKII